MTDQPVLNFRRRLGGRLEFTASGPWIAVHVEDLERQVDAVATELAAARITLIDLAGVRELDTLGAWLLERLIRRAGEEGRRAEFVEVPARYRGLLDEVHQVNRAAPATVPKPNAVMAALETVGRATLTLRTSLYIFLEMLGSLGTSLLRVLLRPQTLPAHLRGASSLSASAGRPCRSSF